jgi:hypothetical protein
MKWRGPSLEKVDDWIQVVNVILAGDICRPHICPACAENVLNVFFVRRHREHGSGWIWCPNCLVGYHCQCIVPSWWISTGLEEEVMRLESPFDFLNSKTDLIQCHKSKQETDSKRLAGRGSSD